MPGLIDDGLSVSPSSLANRKADWEKVLKVWYKTVAYINNPKTHADAVRIMASGVGLSPAKYEPLLKGTKLLTLIEAKAAFHQGAGLSSIYESSKISNDFNVANKVYDKDQKVNDYFDGSLTLELK